MTKLIRQLTSSLFFALLVFVASPAGAQPQQSASSKVPVTTVITVLAPNYTAPPPISKSDVLVYSGAQRQDVAALEPAQGDRSALQLAILIDDLSGIDTQLQDLRKFIESLPKTTQVGVFYADNGAVRTAADFSTNHEAVAQKVRVTLGLGASPVSIYISMMDFMSHWPATDGRREFLVIADGIDRFRGDPASPDVPATIERAQKASITIHTLYAQGGDFVARNLFRQNYGQSNLAQMADATGGQAFFQGLNTPISFTPYLNQLDMVLHNQYFLTFTTDRSQKKKGELRSFRVRSEQHHVEIAAPRRIFVPGP
jgi:hypothetical protein